MKRTNVDYGGMIVDIVDAVVQYSKDAALYEVQCRVNEAMARMRQTAYQCDAEQMSQLTVHLERTKLRLRLLKIRAQSCPPEYQVALEPLFEEAGRRIGELREKRNAIPRGSGGPGRIAGL